MSALIGPAALRRRGFTLLELTLVLALLAALAVAAWPALEGSLDNLRLRRAADQIRAAWAAARNDAVARGEIVAFRCQAGSGEFVIEPFEFGTQRAVGAVPRSDAVDLVDRRAASRSQTPPTDPLARHLPAGVVVDRAAGAAASAQRPAATGPNRPARDAATLLFFPDGSASDGRLTLVDQRGWRIHLALRAVTAMSTASQLVPPAADRTRSAQPTATASR